MTTVSKKLLVGISVKEQTKEFELDIISGPGQPADQIQVINKLKLKDPEIKLLLTASEDISFVTPSFKPGRFTTVGKDSPLKDFSELTCVFKPKCKALVLEKDVDIALPEELDENFFIMDNPDPLDTHFSLETTQFTQVIREPALNGNASPSPPSVTNTNLNKQIRSLSSHAAPVASTSSEKSALCSPIANLTTSNSSLTARTLEFSQFVLPTSYGAKLNGLIRNSVKLDYVQLSSVCRTLAVSIEPYSTKPSKQMLEIVVRKLLIAHPSLAIDNKSEGNSIKFFIGKLQRLFSRYRGKNKTTTTKGRPPTPKGSATSQPGKKIQASSDAEDTVSYEGNVKKLLELYKSSGSADGLKLLWDVTFHCRRREIQSGDITEIEEILQKRCPLLNQPIYLTAEFEKIVGQGLCKKFKDSWSKFAPKLVSVALKSKSKNVNTVICQYEKTLLTTDPEMQSRAAAELLPVLIPGKMKTIEATKLFFDCREESASLLDSIKIPKRKYPFVLNIGDSYQIIADNKTLMIVEDSTEAIFLLFCTFYVFDVVYTPEIVPTYLFIQLCLLGKEDSSTKSCNKLKIFLNTLDNEDVGGAEEN